MRKSITYRILGNGYEVHHIEHFGGELIGICDVNYRPIFEGDIVKGYDVKRDEFITGVIEYVAPSYRINTGTCLKSLTDITQLEII